MANAQQAAKPKYKVGDQVFDMPSQAVRAIIKVDMIEGETYYEVDAPPNPTGDGAFPDGWRNDLEVSDPDKPRTLMY